MTNLSTKTPSQPRMKKLLGAVMLISLAIGQPAFAQAIPDDAMTSLMPYKPAVVVTTDTVADATSTQPTVQDVLLNVCDQRGYGEDCAKTLLGMLWTESSNRSTVIGDHGAARGYFQIHYKLHNIPVACAEDLVCSANWTLDYLESHSYPKYVSYAVQCHNSCGVNNGYAAKVFRNAKLMWSQPLAIDQVAPIEIAMK